MASNKEDRAALDSRRLYIEHLARALEAKETGRITLCPVAYRLCAKRLRVATGLYPQEELAHTLGVAYESVADVLENRFFESNGHLPGPGGRNIKKAADRLIGGLRRWVPRP